MSGSPRPRMLSSSQDTARRLPTLSLSERLFSFLAAERTNDVIVGSDQLMEI